jgi:hypothetical protein
MSRVISNDPLKRQSRIIRKATRRFCFWSQELYLMENIAVVVPLTFATLSANIHNPAIILQKSKLEWDAVSPI